MKCRNCGHLDSEHFTALNEGGCSHPYCKCTWTFDPIKRDIVPPKQITHASVCPHCGEELVVALIRPDSGGD